ncbi:AAA ATPase midasin [Cyanidiococcus yangmingshanensis]|uniref:AAA ATPase midasin n=1 Tax=Cyanidiococcus yangmingshanensis TaxID=2690220 RepID=A0A7J7IN06_9RHOD|nr:AAA ATPase midasin [Cyanidiococcus yangmingshanensis]
MMRAIGDVVERATALSTTAPPADLSDQDADAIVALQQQQQQQQVQGSSGVMTRASSSSSLSTEAKDEKTPASQDRARATATPEPMDVDAAIFQTALTRKQSHCAGGFWSVATRPPIAALTRRLEPILEYNQLTRFAGDFRTGKRLHMRRLVDYVASNYTRDRIWMRRVRPDRRQYDIVVAVDDSASMRESGAYRLALESLVVVATALHRLELGHLGVIRFGVDAQVVHGLADGMPAAGPLGDRLVRQFTFQQEATNIAAMLQCALAMLTEARQQSNWDP